MKYKKDDIVKGKITGVEDYGAFVLFDNGYTGLIHILEISEGFVEDVYRFFKIGEEIEAKVVEVNSKEKKLKLTVKYKDEYKKGPVIEEVGEGFKSLKDNLDTWVEDKMHEINDNNSKKE